MSSPARFDADATVAINRLASETLTDRYLQTAIGRTAIIDQAFADLEADFCRARLQAAQPDMTHDALILRFYRNDLASGLTRRFPSLKDFIMTRAAMLVSLPDVPPSPYQIAMDRALEQRAKAGAS